MENNALKGQEAVDWMLQNLPIRDREEALALGNKMLASKLIKPLNSDAKKGFKDGEFFYSFEVIL